MKKLSLLDQDESKKQCYVYVGHQIKYEPAWIADYQKYNVDSMAQDKVNRREFLEENGVADCLTSVT